MGLWLPQPTVAGEGRGGFSCGLKEGMKDAKEKKRQAFQV